MKRKFLLCLFLLFNLFRLSAQSSMVSTGGALLGSGGVASFTVGEVVYSHSLNSLNSATMGVQQSDYQYFCYGNTVSNLVAIGTNIKWYSQVSGGAILGPTVLLKSMTYYYTHTTNNIISARIPVTVKVSPNARAGTITSPISVCFGGSITFSLTTIVGDAIQWEYTSDAPLSATNTTPPTWITLAGETNLTYTRVIVATNAPSSKFYMRAKVTSGLCTSAYSAVKTVLVNPISVSGTATGGGNICSGSGGIVKLTGYTGKIQWLFSTNGIDYAVVPLATAKKLTVTGLTQNTWYKAKVTSGVCAMSLSNAIKFEIGNIATVGSVSSQNTLICKGTSTTLQLSSLNIGTILWEKSINAGTTWTSALNNTTNFITPALSVTTWFRATTYIGTSTSLNCSMVHSNPIIINVVASPKSLGISGNTIAGINNGTTSARALPCTDGKLLFVTPGFIGNIQWQWSTTSNLLGFYDIEAATTILFPINPYSRATGANYYRVKFTNSCGISVFSPALTVYYKDCNPETKMVNPAIAKNPFDVIAYPNPSSTNFNLDITTSSAKNVEVKVYDMIGKLINKMEGSPSKVTGLQIGDRYPSGVYNVIVSQGTEVKTLRVIKL